jgi:hypothetical protein
MARPARAWECCGTVFVSWHAYTDHAKSAHGADPVEVLLVPADPDVFCDYCGETGHAPLWCPSRGGRL